MDYLQGQSEKAVRVLYIEDDKGLARLVQRRIGRIDGFSVSTAANGEQGLQVIDEQAPDAVIIDYVLPDMSGLDILKVIEKKHPRIVAIVVTGAGDESIAVNVMKHHAQDYIVKDAKGEYLETLPKLITRLLGHQRLIIKQQESDQEIRALSAAVSQSNDGIIMFDTVGVVIYANDAFEQMSGYAVQHILGCNPSVNDGQAWPLRHELWRNVVSAHAFEGKVIEKRKDGSLFPAMISVSPVRGADGSIERYLVSMKDMTDYETLLAEFNQAQKMEAIGTLVGGIAHDFNNTLAAIVGNLYLAKKKASPLPTVVDKLSRVEELCFHASSMIKQMLTFARKSAVEMKPLTINTFLKEIIKLHEVSVPENIKLTYHVKNSDMMISGDISQLQQVMMNLINNARDALEGANNPQISIMLKPFSADGSFKNRHPLLDSDDFACIHISDNGSGIKEKNLEHIFEPFYTTKATGKGTGLGLAMAFGSIQSHDGVIEVESEEGLGTVFKIYLPLLPSENEVDPLPFAQKLVVGSGETILLVDDNQTIIETGKVVLESLGYHVLTAFDGIEAIEVYEKEQADIGLLILDVVMPRLGGVEAAKAIQKINPEVKVIFSTGYDRNDTLRKSDALQEVCIINKPYKIHELSHIIRQCIDG